MAEVIDFEDLKKDSGDLKIIQDSDLQTLSNNLQKLLDLDKTIEMMETKFYYSNKIQSIVDISPPVKILCGDNQHLKLEYHIFVVHH